MEAGVALCQQNQIAHELEVRGDLFLDALDDLLAGTVAPLLGLLGFVGLLPKGLVQVGVDNVFNLVLAVVEGLHFSHFLHFFVRRLFH